MARYFFREKVRAKIKINGSWRHGHKTVVGPAPILYTYQLTSCLYTPPRKDRIEHKESKGEDFKESTQGQACRELGVCPSTSYRTENRGQLA